MIMRESMQHEAAALVLYRKLLTAVEAADVAMSWEMIIHPPKDVLSVGESYYDMVDKVEAPARRPSSGPHPSS
jgi:hypothetical protein